MKVYGKYNEREEENLSAMNGEWRCNLCRKWIQFDAGPSYDICPVFRALASRYTLHTLTWHDRSLSLSLSLPVCVFQTYLNFLIHCTFVRCSFSFCSVHLKIFNRMLVEFSIYIIDHNKLFRYGAWFSSVSFCFAPSLARSLSRTKWW